MAFQYTFRSDDIESFDADTRDLLDNRDRELELFTSTIDNSLSNLNASNLASGTVPSSRVTGSYTGITQVGTLTAGVASYSIGDTGPSGGKIFITPSTSGNTTGLYFEVAPVSAQVQRTWSQFAPINYTSTSVPIAQNATSSNIGAGKANTVAIVNQGNSDTNTCAAKYCDDFTYGGFSDWVLPSRNELLEIYTNRVALGNDFGTGYFWSSSEASASLGRSRYFFNGVDTNLAKDNSLFVRPVRSFSTIGLNVVGTTVVRTAATQDGVILAGRAGGTSDHAVSIVPTTLTASQTVTLPNVSGTAITTGNLSSITSVGTLSSLTVTGGVITTSLGSTSDGVLIYGNGLNSSSRRVSIIPASLTASRDFVLPNVSGTAITTGNLSSITSTGTLSSLAVSGTVTATTFSGALSGNASTATNLSTNRTNWSTNGTISAVVGQLGWKNYGNSHTIFDASQSTSPNGGAVNNTNAQIAWSSTYPTLMGWNGANTYGVRVDSARTSDTASTATTATNQSGGTVSATYLTVTGGEWLRTSSNSGWYNSTYATGIYSKATREVWTYNASRFIASNNSTGGNYQSQQLEVRSNDLNSGGSVAGISFHVYGANAPVLRYWTGTGAGLDVNNEAGSGYWYMGASNFVTRSSMRWKTDIRRRPQEQIVEVGLRLLEGETAIWDSKDIEPIFDEENECYIQPCAEQRELVKDDWIQRRHFNKRGYIVEELEKVFPEAVHYESDGKPSGVDYGVITTELVDILKLVVLQNSDQQRRIELLENKRR